jgi:hypothetical protein
VKFRVINKLVDTKAKRTLRIESTYDTFEDMTDKIVRDLSSLWKGMIPFPFELRIELVNDTEESGHKIFEGDDIIGDTKTNKISMQWGKDVMEVYGAEMKKLYPEMFLK